MSCWYYQHLYLPNLCLIFQVGKETALDEILEDPEVLAQLDWLWSNRFANETDSGRPTGCLVELSKQVDKGCVKEELKPIEK